MPAGDATADLLEASRRPTPSSPNNTNTYKLRCLRVVTKAPKRSVKRKKVARSAFEGGGGTMRGGVGRLVEASRPSGASVNTARS